MPSPGSARTKFPPDSVQFLALLVTLLFPQPFSATHLLVSIAVPLNSSSSDGVHTRPSGSPTGCRPGGEVLDGGGGGVLLVDGLVVDELVGDTVVLERELELVGVCVWL